MREADEALARSLSRRTAVTVGAAGVAGMLSGSARAQTPEAEPVDEPQERGLLTDVPGFLVGHATLDEAVTGCTVILCPKPTVGGAVVPGGWSGTRDMEILSPVSASPVVHALLFTGGSTYGLAAADGVMRWLEERMPGEAPGLGPVPQVPGAVIYDLAIGEPFPRPGADDGYRACEAATQRFDRGSVGAGTGARVGAYVPGTQRMKGGLGSASRRFGDAGVVGALAVVNALGNVVESDGRIVAGAYDPQGRHADAIDYLTISPEAVAGRGSSRTFTTLVAVATNAALAKTDCAVVARMAQAGLARAVHPCFTAEDGDVVVALASGSEVASADAVGIIAAAVVADAIRDAVRQATSLGGVADVGTPGVRSPDDPAWSAR